MRQDSNYLDTIDLRDELSIVIITHNRSADLARTLYNLFQLPEKVNIIVIDNASEDRTAIMVQTLFPEVRLICLEKNMAAVGRNIGVKAANTPFVAFSDDDSWWAPYSLSRALEYLRQYPKVAAVAAKIFVNEERKPDPINRYFETSPLEPNVAMPGPSLMGFLECAVVMHRDAYLAAGGYNEQLSFSGEGALLAIDLVSLGWGITYARDCIAYHYPSTIRDMASRYRMGARNTIWRAWMRRPFKSAFVETWQQIWFGLKHPSILLGCLDALHGIRFVLRERHVVNNNVEQQLQLLAQQNRNLEQKTHTPTLAKGLYRFE